MRRGFTFIEVVLVLCLGSLILGAMTMLAVSFLRETHAAYLMGDMKLESRRACLQIFSRAARGPYSLTADNRGLDFSDGSRVRWEGERLLLQPGSRSMLRFPVHCFTAVRRRGILTLNLELQSSQNLYGPVQRHRFLFDFPECGL